MTATSPVTGRFSAVKTALILFFLLAVWLAFIVMPVRKNVIEKIPLVPGALALKLRAVGLPDNADLDGLPEIFAIWADKAEWKDNRAKFAYRHPVMKTYAYFFQATRSDRGIRFREISEPHDPGYNWDESLSEDCPIRFYTLVHEGTVSSEPSRSRITVPPDFTVTKQKVDLSTPKIEAQPFEPVPIDLKPKR